MADGTTLSGEEARARAYATPLADLHPADPELFLTDALWPVFDRLRREDPVHLCRESEYGPYWSVTRYDDIVAVDTNHQVFSSAAELGGVTIYERPFVGRTNFISMDPPQHGPKRKAIQPIVAPANLRTMEPLIRERAGRILDELPVGETFDWVERVATELTGQMLATFMDYPFEDRRQLTRWSDVFTCLPAPGAIVETEAERQAELRDCLDRFSALWKERAARPPANDLVSMLAHNPATRDMDGEELLGTIILLIVGGNDTTRNSMSGGVLAFNRFPGEWEKVRADRSLITSMTPEIIRWQSPLAHMRRTAVADFELGGKTIRKGDKVVMWYVSGNRDETAIERPYDLVVDRERPREHVAFGFGIHRCVGIRLAELQLRVVWEEILKRWSRIEVMEEPERVRSNVIRGIRRLPVRVWR